MPYVERDASGNISGWAKRPTEHATEFVDETLPEFQAFENREPTYIENRFAAYVAEIGDEPGFDRAVGDIFDSLMKWANAVRFAQSAIADATTLDELKVALVPIANLPQDLDDRIGRWLSIKARFPKPT